MHATQHVFATVQPKDLWSVVVVYDEAATRERAMELCDHLVQQFSTEAEFRFHWWRTDFLKDAHMAAMAGENAQDAQFLIVSCAPQRDLAPAVRLWFEEWAAQRAGQDGALIHLTGAPAVSNHLPGATEVYLREIARRAGIDYLTQISAAIAGTLPDTLEAANSRAVQVTSVLDEIMRRSPPPSHFGLNE